MGFGAVLTPRNREERRFFFFFFLKRRKLTEIFFLNIFIEKMCCLCLWWPTTKPAHFSFEFSLVNKILFFSIFIYTHIERDREQGHSRFPLNAGKITAQTRKEKEIRRNRRRKIIFQVLFYFVFLYCLSIHPSRRNKKMGLSEFWLYGLEKEMKKAKGNYMVCWGASQIGGGMCPEGVFFFFALKPAGLNNSKTT